MRVLLLHNRYRLQGGEERAVADLAGLLRRRGHEVELLQRSSGDAGRAGAARALLRGGADSDAVGDAVRRLGADVVHAHNLHPLLGWRALAAARHRGARTVLHLHNFRLFCAIGIAYRDGAPCFRCRGRDTAPGLRLRCRGSLPEAAVYAAALHRQQPHLWQEADHFIAVSRATADRLIELGLPAARTTALLNFLPDAAFASDTGAGEGEHALVSGRLVAEKGFDTAIAACRAAGVPLVVAGAGPDERRLRALAAGADVRFVGWLAPERLAELRRRAAVALAPSRWEEPCPYAVAEAMAAGVPVLVSDRGGLPELAGAERALTPEQPEAWARALTGLFQDPVRRTREGRAVLAQARDRLGEEGYYARLMAVYEAQG